MSINAAGLRRTALTLHAMPPHDRDWLLSQLEPDEREALGALLDELSALGIPADAGLLEQALRQQPDGGESAQRHRDQAANHAEHALVLADPARLAQLLHNEPELLVARLLHLRDWPWQAQMLAQCAAPRRQQIAAGLRQLQELPPLSAGGERLAACLMTAIHQRLQAQQPAADAAAPVATTASASRWAGLWRRTGGRN